MVPVYESTLNPKAKQLIIPDFYKFSKIFFVVAVFFLIFFYSTRLYRQQFKATVLKIFQFLLLISLQNLFLFFFFIFREHF